MAIEKTLVEVWHDEGYGDNLLLHINNAFLGKDMTAERVVKQPLPSVTLEGIPEGWELVRIGRPVYNVDWVIDVFGNPALCDYDSKYENKPIIRKLPPKPKQYRPFANAAEAEPFWDRKLKYKSSGNSIMRISVLCVDGIEITGDRYTYKYAFENLECDDGTPFGIEVTE